MAADPLEEILHLEDHYYLEGYQQGTDDGNQAGQNEGRTLGLETGFKKFFESGRLYGKTVVWANRLEKPQDRVYRSTFRHLSYLPHNTRLQKNVRALYTLIEPGTLSVGNTDEAVTDFDNRVKRASGKARIVEKATGESTILGSSSSPFPLQQLPSLQTANTAAASVPAKVPSEKTPTL